MKTSFIIFLIFEECREAFGCMNTVVSCMKLCMQELLHNVVFSCSSLGGRNIWEHYFSNPLILFITSYSYIQRHGKS